MEQFRPFNIEVGLVTDFSVNSPKLRLIMLQNLLEAGYLQAEGRTAETLITDSEALVEWVVAHNADFQADLAAFSEQYPVTDDNAPNLEGFNFNGEGYL